jgi:hypothetical protein
LMGNYHDQFLGEGAAVTWSPLPDVRHEVTRYEWHKAQGLTIPCPYVRELLTPPAVAVSEYSTHGGR